MDFHDLNEKEKKVLLAFKNGNRTIKQIMAITNFRHREVAQISRKLEELGLMEMPDVK